MSDYEHLLSVQDLHTTFTTDNGEVHAVNGVSFNLDSHKVLGIVGESGSGKSVTAYSVMQILAENGRISGGKILYKGEDLTKWNEKQMSSFRGKNCSIIFQDPMTSLNPVFSVGNQLMEAITLHTDKRGAAARARAVEMLELVGINEPEKRLKQYPFELSGGMRQRVMIAMALACEPDILIADEPTTALDVTIQAQILELMLDIQKKLGMAIIMEIFYNPRHEYTKGLLHSIPSVTGTKEKLQPIEGTPINMLNMPKGCAFCPRCKEAMKVCLTEVPEELRINENHTAACWINVRDGYGKEAAANG